MTDMYVTSAMIQSILTRFYLDNGKKKGVKDVVSEIYEKGDYVTEKPSFPKEISMISLSDDNFIDLLYQLPICINNIIEGTSNDIIREADILPENSDIFVFKHFNHIENYLHSHNYFEIYYIFKGNCQIKFEKEYLTLKEGDLCIIAPKSLHDTIIDDTDSVVIAISIRQSTFDSAFFTLLSQKDLLSYFFRTILYDHNSPNYILFRTENTNDIKMIIKNLIIENYKDDVYYNNCSISWANILFSYILRNYSETVQFYSDDIENDFSLILHHIQYNYRNLTLKNLAEHFHYNEAYLSTLIKKNMGSTFISLITKLKMSDAKNYLMNTDLSIEQISEYIGYNTVDHFSRTFKKYYKMSPQQYRKATL